MWSNVSFSGGYDTDRRCLAGTLAVNGGDVKLRADITNPISDNAQSCRVLSFSLEKPKFFTIDYQAPTKVSRVSSILGFKWARKRSRTCKGLYRVLQRLVPLPPQGFRFHFTNEVRVLEKPLYLTYSHAVAENHTALGGRLVLDLAHKVSANCSFSSRGRDCKVKYTYVHDGVRTFEPCYDFGKNSWDIAFSQKLSNDEVVRACYESSRKVLGLEWLVDSKSSSTGIFKIKATFDLAKELSMPKLSAESIWSFDL